MKSDYDMLMGAKNNISEDTSALYHQYIPLIHKHIYKLRMKDQDKRGDYAQDAFLRCLKAIEYVDVTKIRDIETWKFFQVFDWFLQNLDKRYRKIIYHTGAEINLSHFYHSEEDEHASDLEHFLGYEDHEITKCERDEMKNELMSKLTHVQKDIIARRQKNQTLASIAKDLKVSYGTVHGHLYHAKKLAETIIL